MKNNVLTAISAVSLISAVIGIICIASFFIEQIEQFAPPAIALLKGLF